MAQTPPHCRHTASDITIPSQVTVVQCIQAESSASGLCSFTCVFEFLAANSEIFKTSPVHCNIIDFITILLLISL